MRRDVMAVCAGLALGLAAAGHQAFGQQDSRGADLQLMQRYREASTSYEKATAAFAARDYDRAEKEARRFLVKMPEYAPGHFLLAKIHYVTKRFPEALAEIDLARQHFDASAVLMARMQRDRLAILQQRRDQMSAQIDGLRASMRGASGEQQLILQNEIAQLERSRNELDEELTKPLPAPDRVPAEYAFIHGNIFLRLQRYSEAVVQYQTALEAEPGYGDAANNLASVYLMAKQGAKALAVLTQAEAKGATVNPELKAAVLAAQMQ